MPHRLTALLVLVTLAAIGCSERTDVLADGDGVLVTDADFREAYGTYLARTGVQDEWALRKRFLEKLVQDQLIVAAARADGADATQAYRDEAEAVREKLLVDRYVQRTLFDTLQVRERDVQEMFVRVNTQLKARHLYAPTEADARVLRARLDAGESFDALAREVFRDPELRANGGSVGLFALDEMDPAFEDAAFELEVGEISEPVRTAQGYSIVQLEDRFTNPILTESAYAAKRDRLARYVRYRLRRAARTQHVNTLRDALRPVYDDATLDALYGQLSGTAMLSDEALAALDDDPLVTFGPASDRTMWTVEDFRTRAQRTDARQRAQVRTQHDLTQFVEGLLVRETMRRRAEAAGWDDDRDFRDAHRRALDAWLLQRTEADLRDAVQVEDAAVLRLVAENPGEFTMPPRVRVHEVLVDTEAEAEAMRDALRRGADPATLARLHSVRAGAADTGGDLGLVTRDQLGPTGDDVFAAAPGDVIGPVPVGSGYAVLVVGAREAARPMTADEARPLAVRHLRSQSADDALDAYRRTLRADADVTLHLDRLRDLPLSTRTP